MMNWTIKVKNQDLQQKGIKNKHTVTYPKFPKLDIVKNRSLMIKKHLLTKKMIA